MANENAGALTFSFAAPERKIKPILRRLADCAELSEVIRCHFDLPQQVWSRPSKRGKLFEHLRTPSAG